MHMKELFGRRLRQVPAGLERLTALAVRAGLVRVGIGGIAWLTLGMRVRERIASQMRAALGPAARVVLPPGERSEGWLELLESELESYRQLPVALLAERAFRQGAGGGSLADPGWTSGLQVLRVEAGEATHEGMNASWGSALEPAWRKLGLAPWRVEDLDGVAMSVEPAEDGPLELLRCAACGYGATRRAARFMREPVEQEPMVPMERVPTPGANTIRALAEMLAVPQAKTLKAVLLEDERGRLVFVVVRGDLEVDLEKVDHALQMGRLKPASEATIRSWGAEPGYASPIGLEVARDASGSRGVIVVADLSVEGGVNFVAGANQPDTHFTGVNLGRDFEATLVADVAIALAGSQCAACGGPLREGRGIPLAWEEELHPAPRYVDRGGKARAARASLLSLSLEGHLAALLEGHASEAGIRWPPGAAPFDVHLIVLRAVAEGAEVARALAEAGLQVLIDDRDVSAGVKFTDADLIGCPVRVTVSPRSLKAGGVEIAQAGGTEARVVPVSEVAQALQAGQGAVM